MCTPEVDKKRSLDSAEADSACFLRSPKSFFVDGGGAVEDFVFFLNFLCTCETHHCFNFSYKFSWKIHFADIDLFCGQKVVFASRVAQCRQNLILFWTFELKHLGLLMWSPYNLLLILILDMWFCNLFNVSVMRFVGYS